MALNNDSSDGSTLCETPALSGTVAKMKCGSTDASWVVGTSPPTTVTVPPTTVGSTVATTTTLPAVTTTVLPATTTTVPGTPLSCVQPTILTTNTFFLNDAASGSNLINTNTPVFSLVIDGPLAQYTVKVDDIVLPGIVKKSSNVAVACVKIPPGIISDGNHQISAVELSPTAQQAVPYDFVTDTIPPSPATIVSASYSNNYVRISGTGIAGFHISVREVGKTGTAGAFVGSSGLWSAAYSRPSGSHQIYAVQADKAGNEAVPSNIVTVVVP